MKNIEYIIRSLKKGAKKKKLLTGFVISNTSKKFNGEYFTTPIRETKNILFSGVIIYSEKILSKIIKKIDGKVDYIIIDAEKKIPAAFPKDGVTANIERTSKELIKKSKIFIFKANDLTLDAIDTFISQMTAKDIRGLGNKNVTILGAGNLGSKLALRMVERGANVTIMRRNIKKMRIIVNALNLIKPKYTTSKIQGSSNKYEASKKSDILICTNTGEKIVDTKIISYLKSNSIILDAGKGTIGKQALKSAIKKNIKVFRVDVSAAFHGLMSTLLETERILENTLGRKIINDISFVSGGLLAQKNEVVVDDISRPRFFYGIGDGNGDFLRNINFTKKNYKKIKKLIKILKLK